MAIVEINRPNRTKPRRYTSSDVKRIVRYARKTESNADMRVALLYAASDLYEFDKLISSLDISIEYLEKVQKIAISLAAIASTLGALVNVIAGMTSLIRPLSQRLLLASKLLTSASENMKKGGRTALILLKLARKSLTGVQNGNIDRV